MTATTQTLSDELMQLAQREHSCVTSPLPHDCYSYARNRAQALLGVLAVTPGASGRAQQEHTAAAAMCGPLCPACCDRRLAESDAARRSAITR